MKPFTSAIGIGLVLAALLPVTGAIASTPIEHFARLPAHTGVMLSPDGRHVAARIDLDGQYGLVVYDLERQGQAPFVMPAGDTEVAWIRWASDTRLLVSLRYALRRGPVPVTETRLVAINADGSEPVHLARPRRRGELPPQIGDQVVALLPDDPAHILMSFEMGQGGFNMDPQFRQPVWKVNIYNDRRQRVVGGRTGVWSWMADGSGDVRLGQGLVGEDWRIVHRAPGQQRWETLFDFPGGRPSELVPLKFSLDDPDLLYVASGHTGDTLGLYSYRISTRTFDEEIFRHPTRDVVGLYRFHGRRMAGVMFSDDEDQVVWFDPRLEAIEAQARAALPGRQPYLVAANRDFSRVVLVAGSVNQPNRFYVFDPDDGTMIYLAPSYPELEGRTLATIQPISYEARDGIEIPGYLTLPPGQPARDLPAIVMPHGGPHARDYARFDPLLQLLADRRYAVLQMNFRGSTGFGREFLEAGYRQWGQAMQDDVTDGTRWLIEQGIADPERICIVGWSYGGYAALMGAAREPGLYSCSVSINGLSDLPRHLSHMNQYVGGRIMGRWIGDSWSDRQQLRENSPVNRVSDIQAPVLLIHGTDDRVVPLAQSQVMARALQRAGHPHQFLEIAGGDHSLLRGEHRHSAFSALDRFLALHLRADPAP